MRAYEFIVEYNQQITIQKLGDKLLAVARKDRTLDNAANITITDLINQLEGNDPTPHKEYVQWLCQLYSNGKTWIEDINSKALPLLTRFDRLKKKKILIGPTADINRYKSLSDLATELSKYPEQSEKIIDKGSSTEFYNDATIRVIIPHDLAAAKYYGQGTQWCTAADKDNMFDRYNQKGKLYIILPKQPKTVGEKYQFHFEEGQYMDVHDDPIDLPALVDRYPVLTKIFDQLARKHLCLPLLSSYPIIAEDWKYTLSKVIKKLDYSVFNSDFPTRFSKAVRQDLQSEGGMDEEGAIRLTTIIVQQIMYNLNSLVNYLFQDIDRVKSVNSTGTFIDDDGHCQDAINDWFERTKAGTTIRDAITDIINDNPEVDDYMIHQSLQYNLLTFILPEFKKALSVVIAQI